MVHGGKWSRGILLWSGHAVEAAKRRTAACGNFLPRRSDDSSFERLSGLSLFPDPFLRKTQCRRDVASYVSTESLAWLSARGRPVGYACMACAWALYPLMATFEKHIFICGNQRPPGHPRGCCDPAAKTELQKSFKQKLAERGLKGRVRANQSGCLDQCEHGPNLVIYPEAVWYGGRDAGRCG